MKKMFLTAFIAILAIGMTADARPRGFEDDDEVGYNQDDTDYSNEGIRSYDDEDEAPKQPQRSSVFNDDDDDDDDGSYGQKTSRASGFDDDDDDYVASNPAPAATKQSAGGDSRPYRFGAHMGLGYGSFWNVPDFFSDPRFLEENSNPYDEWLGISLSMGGVFQYRFNQIFSVAPELNFTIRGFFRTIGTYYYWGYDDEGYYHYGDIANADENLLMMAMDVPLMIRINPIPLFYIEAGAQFSLMLSSEWSITVSDYDTGNQIYKGVLGTWTCESTFVALIFGLGGSVNMGGKMFDIGARLILDMSNLEKDQGLYYDYDGNAFENETRMWTIQLNVGYWI